MGDKLDRAIAEKRSWVERLEIEYAKAGRALDVARAELSAFEAAATFRPAAESVKRKGRQPGAISNDWREVLHGLYIHGSATYPQLMNIAIGSDMKTDAANLRERVRSFVKAGLLEGTPEDGFMVTQEAVTRFGFGDPPEPEDHQYD